MATQGTIKLVNGREIASFHFNGTFTFEGSLSFSLPEAGEVGTFRIPHIPADAKVVALIDIRTIKASPVEGVSQVVAVVSLNASVNGIPSFESRVLHMGITGGGEDARFEVDAPGAHSGDSQVIQ